MTEKTNDDTVHESIYNQIQNTPPQEYTTLTPEILFKTIVDIWNKPYSPDEWFIQCFSREEYEYYKQSQQD